ncbi:hypothetical protein TWF696_005167 [Orbilia brochopaga]|uniref:Uncharacterized protein n=1 Tax=Orbilia brochopaga TaxID=3140254 RepID=A0AAV9V2Z9_9PEZI
MCRYRVYTYACGHSVTEQPPYLPCNPDDFCRLEQSDPPIKIKKNTPCGNETCDASAGMPLNQPSGGGTSWDRTNSGNQGRALGENPADRLRHTVSTKIRVAKLVRSMTKKNKDKEAAKANGNGVDGFLPDNQHMVYEEVGNEMDELKK